MTTEDRKAIDEAQIRKLIDDRANAVRAKDIDGSLSPYTADSVSFDLAPPLQSGGAEALDKKSIEDWFSSWRGPIGYELRDLSVTTGGDLAFCHGLVRISGTKTDGEHNDIWARQTLCLRRIGGTWKIAHEHTSVPFYMDGSYKAAVDLKP
jgi:ketosteroid isomerase-like protein